MKSFAQNTTLGLGYAFMSRGIFFYVFKVNLLFIKLDVSITPSVHTFLLNNSETLNPFI